jgi:hypothetical protein
MSSMFALPLAVDLARDAVAREVSAAQPAGPVVAVVEPAPAVRRTRSRLAAVLHRAADAVAPTEYSPAH